MLTANEVTLLSNSRKEPFKHLTVDSIRRIHDASPRALLLGDGPLFPLPTMGMGWRLWRASGMDIADWLSVFERHNLRCGEHWNDVYAREVGYKAMESAEKRCLPVVFVGSKVANVFAHTWGSESLGVRDGWPVPNVAPRMRVDAGRNYYGEPLKGAFVKVLEAWLYPPFAKVVNRPICCNKLASSHPEHARVPWLRVLCNKEVVLPWTTPQP